MPCFNHLSNTMLRQLSRWHGPAAPFSTLTHLQIYIYIHTALTTVWRTGLLPSDPETVPEELRELEAPTRLTTSPSSSHTPLTIRSLKHQANSLRDVTTDLSPTVQRRFKTFIHGSLVQAQPGALVLEDLAHTHRVVNMPCRAKAMAEYSMRMRHEICRWAEQAEVNRDAAEFKRAQKAADGVLKIP